MSAQPKLDLSNAAAARSGADHDEAAVAAEGCGEAFLGVRRSVRGYMWRERLQPAQRSVADAISQRYDLPEILGRILAARDVGLDEVETVLDPTIKALMPDPSTLMGMDDAAARLADAIAAEGYDFEFAAEKATLYVSDFVDTLEWRQTWTTLARPGPG